MTLWRPEEIPEEWRELLLDIPGYDSIATAEDALFDAKAATDAMEFFPKCLRHVEGVQAGQPFVLEHWQRAIIANLFGWKRKVGGRWVRRYREVLIYVSRKNGKMLALDTPLPTPTGWTTMGEVGVGDTLFDESGKACRVVAVHPIDLNPESYLMTFSNGDQIRACADHLWVTTARVDGVGAGVGGRQSELFTGVSRGTRVVQPTRVRSTREVFETQRFGARRDANHSLRMPSPLQTEAASLPVDPYVLGAWLGDGDSDGARITASDLDAVELLGNIEAAGYSIGQRKGDSNRAGRYRIGGVGVRGPAGTASLNAILRSVGLFGNKHIPPDYLRASFAQRLALLQGLMDTDGTISRSGRGLQFVTIRQPLADGFCELLASLGVKYSRREKMPRCNGRLLDRQCYVVQFMAFLDELPVFRLSRKLNRMRCVSECAVAPRSKTVQVASVEPCRPTPMRCITVDSPSGQFLCGRTMIPTHNSPLASGIALYVFFCDKMKGKQCYLAAADREQASVIFRHCKGMIQQEPLLERRCKVYGGAANAYQSRCIVREEEHSFLRVISADADSKHGGNTHLAIIDELHAQPKRDLVDVLRTSMASENIPEPLMVYLTTADYNRVSICNEVYERACRVRDGDTELPWFLPVVYEAEIDADWTKLETWQKSNPNLGVSVKEQFLRDESKVAQETPAYENTFRRLHCNQRTQQDVRAIPMDQWDACSAGVDARGWRKQKLAELRGSQCFGGLDLGSVSDLTALALLFGDYETGFDVLPFFWCPEETAAVRSRRDGVDYVQWSNAGFISLTEGNETDYTRVRREINALADDYGIRELAADRLFQGAQLCQNLIQDGFNLVAFGQGYTSMAAPTRALLELVAGGRLKHGNNPVLRWMATNAATESDSGPGEAVLKFSKKKSTEKIDGIIAICEALGVAMLHDDSGGAPCLTVVDASPTPKPWEEDDDEW